MTNSSIRPYSRNDRGAYVSALINAAWQRDGLHCWRLVIDVQRELFGRTLPAVLDVAPVGLQGRRIKPRLFGEHEERARWREVGAPRDGAIALMYRKASSPDSLIHAGVFLDLDGGRTLHCDDPHGVVFDSLAELRLRNWSPRWFVPRG